MKSRLKSQNVIMRKQASHLICTINFTIISNVDMTLVNNKYIKVPFSQNVLYHMKNNFLVENSKSPKNYFSWVFTERVTFYLFVLSVFIFIIFIIVI